MSTSTETNCRAMRCNACGEGIGYSNGHNLTVGQCDAFEKAHERCVLAGSETPLARVVKPEAEVLHGDGEWRWSGPRLIEPMVPS